MGLNFDVFSGFQQFLAIGNITLYSVSIERAAHLTILKVFQVTKLLFCNPARLIELLN